MSKHMSFIGVSVQEGDWALQLKPEVLDAVPKSERDDMLELCEAFIRQMRQASSMEANIEQTKQALMSMVATLEHLVERKAQHRLPPDTSPTRG